MATNSTWEHFEERSVVMVLAWGADWMAERRELVGELASRLAAVCFALP